MAMMSNDMHTSLLELQTYKMERNLFKSDGIHSKKDINLSMDKLKTIYMSLGIKYGLPRKTSIAVVFPQRMC